MSQTISDDILKLTMNDIELVERIKASKILLVGAGGIGCEVLKGLLLSGFPKITIIDLDTIDVSNLNRQFLYNKSHVGKSKAEVAAKISIERFAHRQNGVPISIVTPIHDSILNLKYDRKFFSQFTLVIDALDNNTTRIHVNRLCLSSDVPLIESGSAGYNGNVTLIKGGVTQCFECNPPKKDENSYASCTIRNTPSLPIHCIVWAKHLFAQLFGESDEDISPDSLAGDSEYAANLLDAIQNQLEQQHRQTTRKYIESVNYDPKALFEKIFYNDILYLKLMKNLWSNRDRKMPRELFYDKILDGTMVFDDCDDRQITNGNVSNKTSLKIYADQKLWTMKECLDIFIKSLEILKKRLKQQKCLEWDKDDDSIVDFVTSISNFRCYCFYIERKNKFEVKSLAGNIIPAISSTNTVVGGYILLQTIKLLTSLIPERVFKRTDRFKPSKEQKLQEAEAIFSNCFCVYITDRNCNLSKTCIQRLLSPKPDCIACSGNVKEISIELSFDRTTLADLIEKVIIRKFKTVAPDVNCFELKKMIYAAEDEDDLKCPDSFYRKQTLTTSGFFFDGICLNIKDLEQEFEVNVRLMNVNFTTSDEEANNGEMFRVIETNESNISSNVDDINALDNDNNNDDDTLICSNLKRKSISDDHLNSDRIEIDKRPKFDA
ncbi:SUMO-activating enzyme subunit 2 [Sarcoptes scabiei]|nr:SUMO-activating enzyme subunit 2 [Sarcoptes scabiei]